MRDISPKLETFEFTEDGVKMMNVFPDFVPVNSLKFKAKGDPLDKSVAIAFSGMAKFYMLS